MVGALSFRGNRYDGHTPAEQLEQVCNVYQDLGVQPKTVGVDFGYRGVGAGNPGVQIIHRGRFKSMTAVQRRWHSADKASSRPSGTSRPNTGWTVAGCQAPAATRCTRCAVRSGTPSGGVTAGSSASISVASARGPASSCVPCAGASRPAPAAATTAGLVRSANHRAAQRHRFVRRPDGPNGALDQLAGRACVSGRIPFGQLGEEATSGTPASWTTRGRPNTPSAPCRSSAGRRWKGGSGFTTCWPTGCGTRSNWRARHRGVWRVAPASRRWAKNLGVRWDWQKGLWAEDFFGGFWHPLWGFLMIRPTKVIEKQSIQWLLAIIQESRKFSGPERPI